MAGESQGQIYMLSSENARIDLNDLVDIVQVIAVAGTPILLVIILWHLW